MTHTYASMDVSAETYDEIAAKLKEVDYDHLFMTHDMVNGHPTIDMHGIGLTRLPAQAPVGLPQDRVIEAVRAIAAASGLVNDQGQTIDRVAIRLLAMAWCASVRAEWQTFVDADPELKAQHAIALELMREDRYTMDPEPICGLPGAKAPICKVDGVESVCVDWLLAQVTPLSAIYTNRVRLVQSAAARVAKTLAEKAVKQPAEWPLTIASGETFNSIEEMEECPIEAVKEMAKMMRDAELLKSQPRTGRTCWEYFGFDGPTDFRSLHNKYLGAISSVTPIGIEDRPIPADTKLAAEVHRQYQNCLKDLANMTAGPAVSIGDED